jgi:predicted metalloprotease
VAGGGIGTIVIVLIAFYFGVDPSVIINQGVQQGGEMLPTTQQYTGSATENQLSDFISVVLADTEDTWHELFRRMIRTYREPTLVLFSDAVESACGFAQSATGPFYCPADEKVYIETPFLPIDFSII